MPFSERDGRHLRSVQAMAVAFDDLRRSTAQRRVSAMAALGGLTDEELAGFAPDVRDAARDLGQLLPPRGSASRRDRAR